MSTNTTPDPTHDDTITLDEEIALTPGDAVLDARTGKALHIVGDEKREGIVGMDTHVLYEDARTAHTSYEPDSERATTFSSRIQSGRYVLGDGFPLPVADATAVNGEVRGSTPRDGALVL